MIGAGHEDLRLDERVMQLFGLVCLVPIFSLHVLLLGFFFFLSRSLMCVCEQVNTLLAHDRETSRRDLSIRRYSVIPLSNNAGLIGCVS